jgi:lysophospholipase L1-like esterase
MIDFVFTGDSIIEWMSATYYFPDLKISNQGIAGDTINGVLHRLNDAYRENPDKLLVMVGHNDLVMRENSQAALTEYRRICEKIISYHLKKVFITGLLPIDFISVKTVVDFNNGLEKLSEDFGYTFIPVREAFINKNGKAKADLSDGLHLTKNGYANLAGVFKNYIYI